MYQETHVSLWRHASGPYPTKIFSKSAEKKKVNDKSKDQTGSSKFIHQSTISTHPPSTPLSVTAFWRFYRPDNSNTSLYRLVAVETNPGWGNSYPTPKNP